MGEQVLLRQCELPEGVSLLSLSIQGHDDPLGRESGVTKPCESFRRFVNSDAEHIGRAAELGCEVAPLSVDHVPTNTEQMDRVIEQFVHLGLKV